MLWRKEYMKTYRIVAKSSCEREQLLERLNKGASLFELQLLSSSFDEKEIFNTITSLQIDVLTIHTPIIYFSNDSGWRDFNLSDLMNKHKQKILLDICMLADKIAGFVGHNVHCIIHCDLSLRSIACKENPIVLFMKRLIKEYPNVIIDLENISPIQLQPFEFRSGAIYEAPRIVEYLRETLNTKRVGTVLDICHLKMTEYLIGFLEKTEIKRYIPELSVYDAFRENKDTLHIIHLNASNRMGYYENHGLVPSLSLVREVISACEKLNCKVDICIEVKEVDYNNSINFEKTREILNQVIKEYKT